MMKSKLIPKLIRLLPLFLYLILMGWHVAIHATSVANVFAGILASIFLIPVQYWSLLFFEIFLFVPRSTPKLSLGIITIVLSIVNIPWRLFFNDFLFSFAGTWTVPLRILVYMNIAYIITVILVLIRNRTDRRPE